MMQSLIGLFRQSGYLHGQCMSKIAEEWCEIWSMKISTVEAKAMIAMPAK